MNNSDPPPLPVSVLSYDLQPPPRHLWLARLICGLAMMNGLVSAGYVLAWRMPGSNMMHTWTDLPVTVCGLVLAVFGGMGIFFVPGSRVGTVVCAIVMALCNWVAQAAYLPANGPIDLPSVATALVAVIDDTTIPAFVVICLLREPIKGCFRKCNSE